jgi:hypothetical protein
LNHGKQRANLAIEAILFHSEICRGVAQADKTGQKPQKRRRNSRFALGGHEWRQGFAVFSAELKQSVGATRHDKVTKTAKCRPSTSAISAMLVAVQCAG